VKRFSDPGILKLYDSRFHSLARCRVYHLVKGRRFEMTNYCL